MKIPPEKAFASPRNFVLLRQAVLNKIKEKAYIKYGINPNASPNIKMMKKLTILRALFPVVSLSSCVKM